MYSMKIIVSPMCENLLKYLGISDYTVNKNPDLEDGDLAIVLSESKVEMNCLKVKLNTFSQIRESLLKIADYTKTYISNDDLLLIFQKSDLAMKYLNNDFKKEIKVKVYSNFLKDTVLDMGFKIDNVNFDYVVFPDYLRDFIDEENFENLVEISSHNHVSKDPIERLEERYKILENNIY